MSERPAKLRFAGVQVRYAGQFKPRFDFEIAAGELFGVLGESGSGKTTAIKVAAGLIRSPAAARARLGLPLDAVHDGAFLIDDTDASTWEPARRRVALISQSLNLYPHLTVRQNLELLAPADGPLIDVTALAEELNVGHTLDRRPSEISGGENQRVGLAKALINRPGYLCADEPVSALDSARRLELSDHLREFHRRHGCTVLLVSHDQETLLALANRIAFLHEGNVLQIGTPAAILREPEHVAVASALDPAFRIKGSVTTQPGGFALGTVKFSGPALPTGTDIVVLDTRLARLGAAEAPGWTCRVMGVTREFFGGQVVLRCDHGGAGTWRVPDSREAATPTLFFPAASVFRFDSAGRRLRP